MTVSGVITFNQTRDQIITDALIGLGVLRVGGTATTNDLNYCSNKLNKMIKQWVGNGIHIWAEAEGTLYLNNGQNRYDLAGTDIAGQDTVATTLTVAGAGTSLTVTSATGMSISDNIGICLDNNTIQWTTITNISSTTLTINAALTSSASAGNSIFTYTNAITKVLDISNCRAVSTDLTEVPVYLRGRDEFMQIPNKYDVNYLPNQVFYSPKLSDGMMYVYPTPNDCRTRLNFSYQRVVDDFTSGTDNPDLPQEWLNCIDINLQAIVGRTYGKNKEQLADLKQEAQQALMEMEMFDVTRGSIRVVPNNQDY